MHIRLFTNGTVIPGDDVLNVLNSPKILVIVSDYGEVSQKKEELIAALREHGVQHEVHWEGGEWLKVSGVKSRKRTRMELKRQFHMCPSPCRCIYDGRLRM